MRKTTARLSTRAQAEVYNKLHLAPLVKLESETADAYASEAASCDVCTASGLVPSLCVRSYIPGIHYLVYHNGENRQFFVYYDSDKLRSYNTSISCVHHFYFVVLLCTKYLV